MQELARGLVGSEYWELVRVVLVTDLENAKAMLEDTSISDKDFRIKQGAANALRSAHNFMVELSKVEKEKENGEAGD
jgi:hypothetical protein